MTVLIYLESTCSCKYKLPHIGNICLSELRAAFFSDFFKFLIEHNPTIFSPSASASLTLVEMSLYFADVERSRVLNFPQTTPFG